MKWTRRLSQRFLVACIAGNWPLVTWLPIFLEPSSVPKKVGTRFQSHGFHGSGLPIHGSTPLSHGSGTLFHGSALYYVAFSVVLGTTDQLPI